MTAPAQHRVEADGYCHDCGTVGCLRPRATPPRRPPNAELAEEIRGLRLDLAAIADHLGVALAMRCPACGATHRGDTCPNCGAHTDTAPPPTEPTGSTP